MILHVVLSDELFTAYNNNSGYEDNEQYIKCLEDITNWQKHLFSSSQKNQTGCMKPVFYTCWIWRRKIFIY